MSEEITPSFYEDPALQQALIAVQEERWEEGLSLLDAIGEKYPFEPELRNFRQQVQIKAHIDAYEKEEKENARQRRTRHLLARVGLLAAFIVVIVVGSTTYAGVIQKQVGRAQASMQEEFQEIELAIKFRNAQNLLQAGRAEEALVLFEEIQSVDPDYENLEDFMAQARGEITIEASYQQAIDLLDEDQWTDALELLQAISERNPQYRDVPILIERAERNLLLQERVIMADESFAAENWAAAVTGYESVRLSDAEFMREHVESRLFDSYIKAALTVLDDPEAELEELSIADDLFQKALALRPQDEDVIKIWDRARDTVRSRLINRYLDEAEAALVNQEDSVAALEIASSYFNRARSLDPDNSDISLKADLANRYLQAQNDFRSFLWDLVISNLEVIYSFDPDYASGTARQMLYDVYILRGDNYLASGTFELALSDFRRAIELAQENPDGGVLGTYEAQLKVAFTLGLLFDYEGAVVMYQTAVETSNLKERLASTDPAFVSSLEAAENLAFQGNFRLAYIRYRDLFNQNELVYSEFITHVVGPDDYLSSLARLYGSSVAAIVKANDIADPNKIFIGQELIIPIFPDELSN